MLITLCFWFTEVHLPGPKNENVSRELALILSYLHTFRATRAYVHQSINIQQHILFLKQQAILKANVLSSAAIPY